MPANKRLLLTAALLLLVGCSPLEREAISPTNKVYNIRGIPQILLLDPEGKILHRDLRGDAIYDAAEAALQSTH